MKREFRLGAGFPAEVEWGHEVAELLAMEDHAVEDAVHKFAVLLSWTVLESVTDSIRTTLFDPACEM